MAGHKPRPVPTPKHVAPSKRRPPKPDNEEALDEALEESFPASDPPSISQPEKTASVDDGNRDGEAKRTKD